MDEENDFKIEKIATPLGDAASVQSTVNAINYVLGKIKELDDYYTDKLKYVDIASLDPIIEGINEKLNELKANQELINQKIANLEVLLGKINPNSQQPYISLSTSAEGSIEGNVQASQNAQVTSTINENKKHVNEIIGTLINLQSAQNLNTQVELPNFYTILAPEDISKSLESLGAYIDQKDLLGLVFSFLTLPDTEIPKSYRIMLYGPRGNGKTSIAHALAKKYGYYLILPDFSKLMAYSENKQIQELNTFFKKIKENNEIKPCILFLDNFELIAHKNSSRYILSTLILELEKINLADNRILIIAATRNLEEIGEQILKFFDEFVEFSNPNQLEKSKILHIFLEKIKLEDGLDIDDLVNEIAFDKNIEDFSCADLEKLTKIVNVLSIKEHRDHINKADFIKAIQKIKNSNELIKQKISVESPKTLEKLDKIQVLEDEINNLKNIITTSKGIIKHSLRLALSENFDYVQRLFNLYKGNNAPFTIEEASKVLGLSIEDSRKILHKEAFRMIFPEIMNSYHISFDQNVFDEISMEIGFGIQGE